MLKRWTWIAFLLVPFLAAGACADDEKTAAEATAFDVVVEAASAYINDSTDAPGVISAEALFTDGVENYTILDIRAEKDFAAGHIAGAVNTPLAKVLDTAAALGLTADAPIVVACYSGQSAGHAKVALELMGYENVKSLLFGMSSWNTALAKSWDTKTGNALADAETGADTHTHATYDFPVLDNPVESALAERVQKMLDDGFKAIGYSDLIANGIDNYFVINYFGEADYAGTGESGVPGHIPGSHQFTPYKSLGVDQMLNLLPTDKPIVVYCWTGQHSSQVTAYLNILGYEAYSLKNGSNALFYDSLTAHKWSMNASHDYPLEAGALPTPAFEAVADAAAGYVNDNTKCPGVIKAADLVSNGVENYKILDLRKAADFAAGHIEGAINTTLPTLLDDVASANIDKADAILVVCYTGQTAGHAKAALEMLGYTNSKSLLFGMAAWNSTLSGKWDGNVGNNLATAETTANNDKLVAHAFPKLDGYTADTVTETRVAEVLADGFAAISYSDMVTNGLENYFIVNYFGEADYMGTGDSGVPGHIPGAFQFTPYKSLGLDDLLMYLPTDMPVVVYCWTGQHSSQVTFYLNMLGYDAHSMLFGSNGLFHDALTAHKWGDGAKSDYPLVTD